MPGAAQRVLDTGELVEKILTFLIPNGCDHKYRELIRDPSGQKRRTLEDNFARRKTLLLCQRLNLTCKGAIEASRTLQRALFFLPPRGRSHTELDGELDCSYCTLRVNPFLGHRSLSDVGHDVLPFEVTFMPSRVSNVLFSVCYRAVPVYSWRNMYLANPSLTVREIFVDYNTFNLDSYTIRTPFRMTCKAGVLVDRALEGDDGDSPLDSSSSEEANLGSDDGAEQDEDDEEQQEIDGEEDESDEDDEVETEGEGEVEGEEDGNEENDDDENGNVEDVDEDEDNASK